MEKQTLGQIIDELADEYFAAGLDSYSAGLKALIEITSVYVSLPSKLAEFISKLGAAGKEDSNERET